MQTSLLSLFTLTLSITACALDTPENPIDELAETESEIQGGQLEIGFPAVGQVSNSGSTCTGTLLSPGFVLTAKHCLGSSMMFKVGTDATNFVASTVDRTFAHPSRDLALLHLAAPIRNGHPFPINTGPAPAVGTTCTAVGFGIHQEADGTTTVGTKRSGLERVTFVQGALLEVKFVTAIADSGDSGGPLLCNGKIAGVVKSHSDGNWPSHTKEIYTVVDPSWIASTMAPFAASEAQGDSSGTLVGFGSNCLDVYASDTSDGNRVYMYPCFINPNQRFSYVRGQFSTIGGKRLDALGWYDYAGAPVGIWTNNGAWNQQWQLANAELRGLGGKVIDLLNFNTAEGSTVGISSATSGQNQRWTFTAAGEIRGYANKCLDVDSPNPTAEFPSVTNGTPVVYRTCNGSRGQTSFWPAQHGIRGLGSKCVTVENASAANGARLVMWDCNGGTNQDWTIKGEIRSWNDKCLDVYGSQTAPGTPVLLYPCYGTANQQWTFEP